MSDNKSIQKNILVNMADIGTRLDKFLSEKLKDFSRAQIIKYIENESILVNGKQKNKNYLVKKNDVVSISILENEAKYPLEPYKYNLEITYEDDYIMVVNKPKGMLVYPTKKGEKDTLANVLLALKRPLSNIAGEHRPGIVHRLDKETSGLIMIAKDNITHKKLIDGFLNNNIKKIYYAVVIGKFENNEGEINLPIGRDEKIRTIMSTSSKKTRDARTIYKVIDTFSYYTLLEIDLITGRKHQIRVHLNAINRPIVGDTIYNNSDNKNREHTALLLEKNNSGQYLHSKKIIFFHPILRKNIEVSSDLPEYLLQFIEKTKKN